MLRAFVGLVLATSVAVAAPVPKVLKAKAPELDGWWTTAERVNQGKDVTEPWVWQISGERLTTYSPSRGDVLRRTHEGATTTFVRPDPAKPDELDYRYSDGRLELVYRGRVKWDGDEWVFCFAEAGADRPAEVKAGKDVYYLRFKRTTER
jgi:hypothetical protein